MNGETTLNPLGAELAARVRTVLEFHLWGGSPEGVTAGGTQYETRHAGLRRDSLELEALLTEIERHFRGKLPAEAATWLSAGRMYRRAADFVKAKEYFLRALEEIHAVTSGENRA